MKPIFLTALLSLLCYMGSAQRISIHPSVLDFKLHASQRQAQTVRITNLSDKKITFHAYLADWLRDSTGGHQYFRPDTLSRSCASWVQLSSDFVEVAPGTTEELIVTMKVPEDAGKRAEMKWAMLFIQSADEKYADENKSKEMETQVKEILRVGVHIYETPPNVSTKSISALSFKPLAEPNNYELVVKNTGNVMVQCKGYIELTDPRNGKTFKTDKVEFPIFPEGTRKVRLPLPADIPKGKYSALAIIDLGEDAPLEGIERTVEVK